MSTDHEHHDQHAKTPFLPPGGAPMTMAALTFAFLGFVAGLVTMIVISLYKYVIKIISH